MLRPAALILVAVLCVGLSACRQPPNIVMILTDDQSNYDAKGARVIAPGQRAALAARGGGGSTLRASQPVQNWPMLHWLVYLGAFDAASIPVHRRVRRSCRGWPNT